MSGSSLVPGRRTMSDLISNDPQRLFNHVVRKLAAQGRPSRTGDHCMYLARNGDRCAAGWCFTKKTLERAHALEEEEGFASLDSLQLDAPGNVRRLLAALQNGHDLAESRDELYTSLLDTAEVFDLKIEVLSKVMGPKWRKGKWGKRGK